jgi:iron complex transport system substrate-binding protein
VCLTEETVETLYLLGEDQRIVGVSGYAVRPPRVRREKPRISSFVSADVPKILALEPDLALAFSDLQADIVRDLVKAGVAVHAFNHRDIEGIYGMIRTVGALVGASAKATALVEELTAGVEHIRVKGAALPCRPRVYFEEWDEPMICGIRWVSELIEIAGGQDVFREKARSPGAQGRIVSVDEVATASPDLIIGSWCGKKFVPSRVTSRPGLEEVAAVQNQAVHEIKSSLILQPGPAALTDGLSELYRLISEEAFRAATR